MQGPFHEIAKVIPVFRQHGEGGIVRHTFHMPGPGAGFEAAHHQATDILLEIDVTVGIAEYRQICFDPEQHRNAFRYLGSYAHELPIIEERLPSLAVPTLITWGAHDQFVRPTNAERLHALLPNSELTVFEDAGHFSHEDADDEWLARFVTFVDHHDLRNHTSEKSER